jgi:hypothetical protein
LYPVALARARAATPRYREERLSPDGQWDWFPKAPYLLQYVSNGNYYARTKVKGKVIPEVPHAGAHYDWGSTRAGKIGTAGSLVLIEGTAPVPPVHTSSVKVRQQVLKYQRTDGLKPILELTR